MFEIFKAKTAYKPKKDSSLSTHPRSQIGIAGFVPDKHYPEEGGSFRMFHHRTAGLLKFGDISLKSCHNVIEEDELVYFEDESGVGKYILLPYNMD